MKRKTIAASIVSTTASISDFVGSKIDDVSKKPSKVEIFMPNLLARWNAAGVVAFHPLEREVTVEPCEG
ncbi:hypothetical protein MMC12_008674 [Toensbergia leucococca]|nr:hypothetical protein [Toensbergia leucococca]